MEEAMLEVHHKSVPHNDMLAATISEETFWSMHHAWTDVFNLAKKDWIKYDYMINTRCHRGYLSTNEQNWF